MLYLKYFRRHSTRHDTARSMTPWEPLEARILLSAIGTHPYLPSVEDAPLVQIDIVEPHELIYLPPSQHLVNTSGTLTGATKGDALDIALAYLVDHRETLGLTREDLHAFEVTDRYVSPSNGVTHLYLRQTLDDIEVINADINVNVNHNGAVINVGSMFLGGLSGRASSDPPSVFPDAALAALADRIGLPLNSAPSIVAHGATSQGYAFEATALSLDPIPVGLHYVPRPDGAVELAWNFVVRTPDLEHWYDASVSTRSGEVIHTNDWFSHATYNVFHHPTSNPNDAALTLIANPEDPAASPLGWHDINKTAGVGEFTDTRGNNVYAQEDANANNIGGFRPDGGASLTFVFPLDLQSDPIDSQSAAISNLFYWNNHIHDVLFHYGFDEAAGNFQRTNFSGQGAGDDAVWADALDGAGLNNADFATPPDGIAPRMQMFEWIPDPHLTINSPGSLAGDFVAGLAQFGPALGITGDLVAVTPALAGSPLTNASEIADNIALIERGTVTFVTKVRHAQQAGAIGVVIVDNTNGSPITMSDDGTGDDITIPSLFISKADGETLKNAMASDTVNVTLRGSTTNRDSSLDNGIIVHEYGHGVSTRLTAGSGNSNGLDATHSSGMGEGWSDYLALAFTQSAADGQFDAYPIGTYLLGQSDQGVGIRNHPYSYDMSINPLTFSDIAVLNTPHGIGEVWASALWDLNWLLINGDGGAVGGLGFDEDLGAGTGGNNLLLQLVLDAIKLQPSNPSFLEARDAIVAADTALTGGTNHLAIWTAFARRGMGFSAGDNNGNPNNLNVIEAFDLPEKFHAPYVVEVLLSGSTWTAAYLTALDSAGLGNGGYAVLAGGAAQLDPLGNGTIDRITIRFNETVNIDATDLTLTGALGPGGKDDGDDRYVFDAFSTQPGPGGSFDATWTLQAPLPKDRLLLVVDADLSGGITNAQDKLLDGDFLFRFDVLPGNVNGDQLVDGNDLAMVLGHWLSTSAPSVLTADFNGDGWIGLPDLATILGHWLQVPPVGTPSAQPAPPTQETAGDPPQAGAESWAAQAATAVQSFGNRRSALRPKRRPGATTVDLIATALVWRPVADHVEEASLGPRFLIPLEEDTASASPHRAAWTVLSAS